MQQFRTITCILGDKKKLRYQEREVTLCLHKEKVVQPDYFISAKNFP